jgi:hypothetical protein
LEDRENFLEGPIAPFHHSTDMETLEEGRRAWYRILARTLRFPTASTPSSTSWPALERVDLSEFLKEYPQMEGGIGPPQGESMDLSELSDGIP